MDDLQKYPRTRHIQGSRLQPGDEDLSALPFSALRGRHLVTEEKIDGANAAVSFSPGGDLRLQSRGHFLTGGDRERHFNLFKRWASAHEAALRATLGARYVLYGEWLYAKHTIFYDELPHYFLEFDVLDRDSSAFLSTPRRRALLAELPVTSVPVLAEGPAGDLTALTRLMGPSAFKGPAWRDRLRAVARERGLDEERALRETDPLDAMEGLYLKVEEDGQVVERYKFIRPSFVTAVLDSGTHWLSRPIVPNQLRPGADLFLPAGGAG